MDGQGLGEGGKQEVEMEDVWEDDACAVAPKAKAKGKAKAKNKGQKEPKGNNAGGKKQPVTSCIVPSCPFPKYPGSRFCSTADHKKAFDNMMYQRKSRKDLSKEEKEAFDAEMKDDGAAGKAVGNFARDNPPEMKRKGLVDFAKFVRSYGQRVSSKASEGTVPMTERAFFKHAENVMGLTDDEAKEAWQGYEKDPGIERDNKGFRGLKGCGSHCKSPRQKIVNTMWITRSRRVQTT